MAHRRAARPADRAADGVRRVPARLLGCCAAIVALIGCKATFPERGPVYIDPRIPAPIQTTIHRAHADWCNATRGRYCVELKTGRGANEYVWGERDHDNAGAVRGWFGCKVYVDLAGMHRSHWLASMKHEGGHCGGLEHTDYGLMFGDARLWKRPNPGCIDQLTLADHARANDYDPNDTEPECIEAP
jgi:hypothetical protein